MISNDKWAMALEHGSSWFVGYPETDPAATNSAAALPFWRCANLTVYGGAALI
jgi:hypothetical protein